MSANRPMVYLYEQGVLGELISYNAHASTVGYSINGTYCEVMILNEDFEIIEEMGLGLDDYYE